MKVILSRKGFDLSAGGVASPIADGELYSLPIPEDVKSKHQITYSQLTYRIFNRDIGTVIENLTNAVINGSTPLHLDPDLDVNSYPRQNDWAGLFGQTGTAQTHLQSGAHDGCAVGKGDLFLFFGWFRDVEEYHNRIRYIPKAPNQHIIFGYMQVGEVWSLGSIPTVPAGRSWAAYHPHFSRSEPNNTLYVASERLAFAPQFPGYGIFRKREKCLVLSDKQDTRNRRSFWRLDSCFAPKKGMAVPLSYHGNPDRWDASNGNVILKSVGRGQEFIVNTETYPEIEEWAKCLIENYGFTPRH